MTFVRLFKCYKSFTSSGYVCLRSPCGSWVKVPKVFINRLQLKCREFWGFNAWSITWSLKHFSAKSLIWDSCRKEKSLRTVDISEQLRTTKTTSFSSSSRHIKTSINNCFYCDSTSLYRYYVLSWRSIWIEERWDGNLCYMIHKPFESNIKLSVEWTQVSSWDSSLRSFSNKKRNDTKVTSTRAAQISPS